MISPVALPPEKIVTLETVILPAFREEFHQMRAASQSGEPIDALRYDKCRACLAIIIGNIFRTNLGDVPIPIRQIGRLVNICHTGVDAYRKNILSILDEIHAIDALQTAVRRDRTRELVSRCITTQKRGARPGLERRMATPDYKGVPDDSPSYGEMYEYLSPEVGGEAFIDRGALLFLLNRWIPRVMSELRRQSGSGAISIGQEYPSGPGGRKQYHIPSEYVPHLVQIFGEHIRHHSVLSQKAANWVPPTEPFSRARI